MENQKFMFIEKKICVLVPTYNNEQTLAVVLENVLQYTNQVIVVNDGSTDSTSDIIKRFSGLEVVHYPVNKGKGYALRQGLKRALDLGYEYAITIDSDGQHFADDLPAFVKATDARNGIIIGERNMDQAGIPGKSNFGRNFSNFWFRFETGIKLNDTQSGYRLYPVKALSELTFFTSKFEFEIEVLVRAAWAGIPIEEIPVKVFYPEKGKRVTHFRPFRDFSRISVLNTVLVTITLLYIKPRDFFRKAQRKNFWSDLHKELFFSPGESDLTKAISVGFGVFMGIVPIWGFQLMVAIALAFILKLNKPLVIIAANISIPPMIPLILFLSHLTGAIWMGDHASVVAFDQTLTLDVLKNNFFQYVVGAITLSIGSGLIFGAITYCSLQLFKRAKPG
jgi:glycosyltransferase involved in cell wall biosynthesis